MLPKVRKKIRINCWINDACSKKVRQLVDVCWHRHSLPRLFGGRLHPGYERTLIDCIERESGAPLGTSVVKALCEVIAKAAADAAKLQAIAFENGPAANGVNKTLLERKLPKHDELIGSWIMHRGTHRRVTLFRKGKKIRLEVADLNAPAKTVDMLQSKEEGRTVFRWRYQHPDDEAVNRHLILMEDGSLIWYSDLRPEHAPMAVGPKARSRD